MKRTTQNHLGMAGMVAKSEIKNRIPDASPVAENHQCRSTAGTYSANESHIGRNERTSIAERLLGWSTRFLLLASIGMDVRSRKSPFARSELGNVRVPVAHGRCRLLSGVRVAGASAELAGTPGRL